MYVDFINKECYFFTSYTIIEYSILARASKISKGPKIKSPKFQKLKVAMKYLKVNKKINRRKMPSPKVQGVGLLSNKMKGKLISCLEII